MKLEGDWVVCEICGKRLLKRTKDGMWHFKFGRFKDDSGQFIGETPVELKIAGQVLMKCLVRNCGHQNMITNLPFDQFKK